jgi:asparagine synthase (glutamine-hydrolysing)
VPTSDEDEWQELLIAHLGIKEWLRLDFTDELDVVGPFARRALRRHGLLWPCNAHFHLPLLEAAAGGALITGVGGDELFTATTRSRAYAVLGGLARPRPRDVLTIGLAVAPRPVRREVHARRIRVPFGWLQPPARHALVRAAAREDAREPIAPAARLRFLQGARPLRIATASLATLAADHDVLIGHPLAAPEVAAAVARFAPKGFSGRTAGMRALLGDVLPQPVIARSTKATFDGAFFHDHSRAFAPRWQGDGVPAQMVDAEALSREWLSPAPTPQSMTLLQAAWLAGEERSGERFEQPLDGVGERVPAARPA